MDAAHIHLMLNHFPLAGMLFAIPFLLLAWWRESDFLGRTGMFVVLATGLITIPTFLTGEPAEEIIEHLPGISEKLIKLHEETAEKAIWFVGAATLGALISLIIAFRKKKMPISAIPWVAILAVCSVSFLVWTNNQGGQISHPEIRSGKAIIDLGRGEANETEDKD